MAFVYKSDRSPADFSKSQLPGPGQYSNNDQSRPSKGFAPFLSTTGKHSVTKKVDTMPGPGTYDASSSFQTAQKGQKIRYATLNRKAAITETSNQSTIFKSKVQRFISKEGDLTPGPGTYSYEESVHQRRNSYSHNNHSHINPEIERTIEQSRKAIPSIPSHANSYGYSEIDSILFLAQVLK